MFCKNCGEQMDDLALACPKCGTAVVTQTPPQTPQYQQPTYQQTPPPPPQYQQPTYQQPQYQQYQPQSAPVQDVPSGGLKFLAFCVPIVGLILYFVWKDQKPLTAKSLVKPMIIGFIVINVLPTILYIILLATGVWATSSYDYYYQIANFASKFFAR